MINLVRNVFKDNCKHRNIRITDRKVLEHKCDCCSKILSLNEQVEYVVEYEARSNIHNLQTKVK